MLVWSFRSAVALALLLAPLTAWAQLSAEDRADIVRLAQARGGAEGTIAPLLQEADRAVQLGVPLAPVVNKIKEGVSKGFPAARVLPVVRDLITNLQAARDMAGSAGDETARTRSTLMLAEALGRGVTRAEIDELRTLTAEGGNNVAPERLALGARTWASLKEAGFAQAAALPIVADALRQGLRDADLLTLSRETIARRDVQAPERPRVERQAAPERPQPTRPEAQRPEAQRPATPERAR